QGSAPDFRRHVLFASVRRRATSARPSAPSQAGSQMRGHIARKGSRYYVVVDVARDPATRRRRQQWHGSWTTKKDAERELTKIVRNIDAGTHVDPDRVTLKEFLTEEWLPALSAMKLRASTIELYRTLANAYVIPHIGNVPLQKLTTARLNRLYAD